MAPTTSSASATHKQKGEDPQQDKQAGITPKVVNKPHKTLNTSPKAGNSESKQHDGSGEEESKQHGGSSPAKRSGSGAQGDDDKTSTAQSLTTSTSDPHVGAPSASAASSSAAASNTWGRTRHVTRAEYARWSASALVEMSGFSYVDEATQVPALWEVPPERTTGSPLRLIGVPADESAVLNGARLRNGYGGLEALQAIEMFSAQDRQDLEATIQADNVQDLLPEFTSGPPSDSMLATMLGALTLQREFASLLTAFRSSRLAERVFNLMTALKRLLAQHRLVRAELGRSGDAAKDELIKLRADNVAFRREWQAMTAYWEGEVMRAERVQVEMKQEFTSSLRRQEEDHQYLQNGYVDELNQMREQLNDTCAQCEILRRDLREQSLGPWAFSDFLEAEPNVKVSGNWKRLQELFGHFAAGTKPSAEWITNIHVMAADQPRCVCGDFKVERDQARLDDESKPPSNATAELNLSGPGSAVKRTSSKRPSHQDESQGQCTDQASFEDFRRTLQLRPTSWPPSKTESRPAKEPLVMTKEEARKSLPGPQIWAELRPDLRYVMLAGHSYEQALKLVREDNVLHPMFHRETLRDMFASMILVSELDSTPWAQYVPEVYYLSAETKLESIYCRAETVEV